MTSLPPKAPLPTGPLLDDLVTVVKAVFAVKDSNPEAFGHCMREILRGVPMPRARRAALLRLQNDAFRRAGVIRDTARHTRPGGR